MTDLIGTSKNGMMIDQPEELLLYNTSPFFRLFRTKASEAARPSL